MKITIRKPIGYTQIGRKDQQEDAVWPPFDKVTADSRCIVLCDGVGGSAHGEIASQTTSKVIGGYLTSLIHKNGIVTDTDVQDAIKLAYDELEKIDTEGSVDGQPSMATTLTCVCIHDEGILAAHMGDSRIYLVRPGQGLLYQSSDHSLVNALLQAGELTLEEAKTYPRKNVITKAIQPHAQKRFNAEVHQLTDVRSGDYIFLCCDGVFEQLTNERLVEILSMKCSDEKKLALLEAESTDRTKDNYTAYLIPINKVEGESTIVNDDEVTTVVVERQTNPVPTTVNKQDKRIQEPIVSYKTQNNNKKIKLIGYSVGALVLLSAIFVIGQNSKNWFGGDKQKVDTIMDTPDQGEDVTDVIGTDTVKANNDANDNVDGIKIKSQPGEVSEGGKDINTQEQGNNMPSVVEEQQPVETGAETQEQSKPNRHIPSIETLKLKQNPIPENTNDTTK